MPNIELLFEELTELKIVKQNRVDHPRKLSKDLADAVCGAIFGAISHTPRDRNTVVEIHEFRDRKPQADYDVENPRNVIHAPKAEVEGYLRQFNIDLV
jgi:hypothetical protein